jgi:6-phosphogluconolactonase
MTEQLEVVELGFPDDLAREAARRFIEIGQEATAARGSFSVALSGGNTPRAMYARLVAPPLRDYLDWTKVHIFFSDERFVPPDSEESNYHTARENLLTHVSIPDGQVHPYSTVDSTPEESAKQYEDEIRRGVKARDDGLPAFDLILLGMGPDGHTASLFPDTEALKIHDRLVAPNYVPKLNAWRLSFTYPLLNAGRTVTFLVQGEDKKERVREVLGGGSRLPAAGVQPSDGRLVWLLDAAAGEEFVSDVPDIELPLIDLST